MTVGICPSADASDSRPGGQSFAITSHWWCAQMTEPKPSCPQLAHQTIQMVLVSVSLRCCEICQAAVECIWQYIGVEHSITLT
jgi:hypothetical protein